ncbi:MAG: hypothetical protein A2Z78_00205 [Candidatus Nealsonbacteria bacterium RBG_13_36_15]|uniref:Phage holin family protein n=1 Tax=Candidatus Nealsonbacteria bacterium RBG_13_36_15 TaxID=1801660 RepID=A0A1G2DXJ9_9BACT|nr:MAG: hypothetical protein A2Z78_00205 [Candidatus Nealsonbacteria bacterium RBG_13_36_15]
MRELVLQIVAGILGLWLAVEFVPEVEFVGDIKYLLIAGLILGLLNFFIRPILNFITLPLRLLTLGLFGLIINVLIIWTVDLIFYELAIPLITPLLWTTLIIWGLGFIVSILFPKPKQSLLKPS